MMRRTHLTSLHRRFPGAARYACGTAVVLMTFLISQSAMAENEYPTFGLPSSAFRASASNLSAAGQTAPQPLSPSQTASAQHISERSGQLHHELPFQPNPPARSSSPIQQTAGSDDNKPSIFGRWFGREDQSASTTDQSSVRREPMAELQQNPPRHDAAVRPTDGRRNTTGMFAGWFGREARPSTAPLTRPPAEPAPYRPQANHTPQPQTRSSQPPRPFAFPAEQPQRLAGTAASPPPTAGTPQTSLPHPNPALQNLRVDRDSKKSTAAVPRQSPAVRNYAAELGISRPVKPPTITPNKVTPNKVAGKQPSAPVFQMMPLTEPVLAPPADENWTPEEPLPKKSTAIARMPQTANSHREIAPPVVSSPATTPSADKLVIQPEPAGARPDEFLLPRRSPGAQAGAGETSALSLKPQPAIQTPTNRMSTVKSDLEPSPYTGLRLGEDAGAPAAAPAVEPILADDSAAPADQPVSLEPGQFFPNGERAIEPERSLDIGEDLLIGSGFEPSGVDVPQSAEPDAGQAPSFAGSPMQQITSRSGGGLKGFCPVALRDKRMLLDGRVAFATFYAGKTYYFSSEQAKAQFDDKPIRYAPAADGNDVTQAAITGELQEGSLDHAVWYKDRLYLFTSAENLKTFMAAPSAMDVEG